MAAPGANAAREILRDLGKARVGRAACNGFDAIVVGAGHNGLVAAATSPRPAGRSWCWSGLTPSAGRRARSIWRPACAGRSSRICSTISARPWCRS